MGKRTELVCTVYRVTRGRNSASGNPSYTFHTDAGRYTTETDGACNYAVENDWPIGTVVDRAATLALTATGRRIVGWKIRRVGQ